MMDWDDVRYFLAVAREGSVRAAAERLKVNHSTALRRISHLEDRLGVQMFERLPSGYSITAAGEEAMHTLFAVVTREEQPIRDALGKRDMLALLALLDRAIAALE